MNWRKIIYFLGFHIVEVQSEFEGKIFDKHTYWEWGIRIKIPFTTQEVGA